jgi:uncharacterized protein (DUF4415 family)
MSRITPGMPIPGTEKTISAADIAAELGLRPGSAPKEGADVPLTPEQARKLMSDEYPGETPDLGWETITISGGRDVMDVLGVNPATLPLGAEAELGAPQPRPERRPHGGGVPPTPPLDASTKAELAADFRAHAAKVAEVAASAKQSGDAAREAKAAAAVRASAEVGEALKARGVL